MRALKLEDWSLKGPRAEQLRLTHIQTHTDGEMCVSTGLHSRAGRKIQTDIGSGVMCIGVSRITHTHLWNKSVWYRKAQIGELTVQAWQEIQYTKAYINSMISLNFNLALYVPPSPHICLSSPCRFSCARPLSFGFS